MQSNLPLISRADIEMNKLSLWFFFYYSYVVMLFILGGANENYFIANALLQYLGVPVLVISIYILIASKSHIAKILYPIFGLILLFILVQLSPLPEGVWRQLPFHVLAENGLSIANVSSPGTSLSLDPNMTWVSILSIIPTLAIFFGFLSLKSHERSFIILVMLACGIMNAFLGFVQLSQNSEKGTYLYPNASAGDLLGFFKNRNHFSALMYTLIPFATVVANNALGTKISLNRRNKSDNNLPLLMYGLSALFILIVACVMARSRAGVGILMVALLLNALLPRWKTLGRRFNTSRNQTLSKILIGFVLFSLLFALEFGFSRLLVRFEAEPLQDARMNIAKNTFHAAWQALPYGTGLGTFQKIYGAIEPVRDAIPHKFANRAHNDYLEFTLETGILGVITICGFILWYSSQTFYLWFRNKFEGESLDYARAASISIGLLLLHSLVDYPLRTQALMGLFAICCAFLLVTPSGEKESDTKY